MVAAICYLFRYVIGLSYIGDLLYREFARRNHAWTFTIVFALFSRGIDRIIELFTD
jgi:hypothetical protein